MNYFWIKIIKGAVEAYDKTIALDPNLYYVYAGRAEARAELGAFKEALDDYNIYKNLSKNLIYWEILKYWINEKALVDHAQSKDSKPDDLSESMLNSSSELTAADEVKAIYFRGKLNMNPVMWMALSVILLKSLIGIALLKELIWDGICLSEDAKPGSIPSWF